MTGQRSWNLAAVAEMLSEQLRWPVETTTAFVDGVTRSIGKALSEQREVQIEDFAKIRLAGPAGQAGSGAPFAVPSADFVSPLAAQFGMEGNAIEEGARAYFKLLKERLSANDKLKIDRFLALKVTEEKARIVDDPISGQRLIAPSRKVISFMAHPKFKQLLGGQDIAFVPSVSLKEGVEAIKNSNVLLAIPQKDFFTDTIEFHFNRAGWNVIVATSIEESLRFIESGQTFLAIIDASLPNYVRLCEEIKVQRHTSLIPTIVMLPQGHDPMRAKEFRVLGNEEIAQPFEIKQLLSIAEAELQRASEEQIIFAQEVHFQFPTTDENIDRANELAARLFSNSGLDEEGHVALCAAFREGVGNAAQHGNRHRRDKNIDVMYLLDHEKITVIVSDEGKGFDWRLYVDDTHGKNAVEKARRRHLEGKLGGLGIMLILKCTDRLEYNEVGNVLTEYKYLAGKR